MFPINGGLRCAPPALRPLALSFAGLDRLAAAEPIRRIKPCRHASAKAGKRPIAGTFRQTVLYRVEVDVVQMGRIVPIVADRALPIAALPDSAIALSNRNRRSLPGIGQ